MRFAFGLAVLALVLVALAWSWWHMIGRARRTGRMTRRGPQVMIDVALSGSGGGIAEGSAQSSEQP